MDMAARKTSMLAVASALATLGLGGGTAEAAPPHGRPGPT